jgi:hypothetical protein
VPSAGLLCKGRFDREMSVWWMSSSPSPLHARYSEGATSAQHALQAPLAMELIAELQVMDEKARTDVRFIAVMDWLSHTES